MDIDKDSIIYVSGPMTGYENYNFERFDEVAQTLKSKGYTVINPADDFSRDQSLDRATYMRGDIYHVMQSDAVVVLDFWHISKGARMEVHVADQLSIPVYRYKDGKKIELHSVTMNFDVKGDS